MLEVLRYVTANGKDIVGSWLGKFKDQQTRARIAARLTRLSAGHFGDCKPLHDGVCELRIDFGPGYRVYYAMIGQSCVLLLCGGDKRKQSNDIERAIQCLHDYKRRTAKP